MSTRNCRFTRNEIVQCRLCEKKMKRRDVDHHYKMFHDKDPLNTKAKTYELEFPLDYQSKIIKTKPISTFFDVVQPQNNNKSYVFTQLLIILLSF